MADYPECPKCSDIYGNNRVHIKAPKILDCGDSICKECLEELIKDTNKEFFFCPKCNEEVKNKNSIDEYITNNEIIRMVKDCFNIQKKELEEEEEEEKPITYNLIALGQSGVGKTCLFGRLSKDNFSEKISSTVGCDMTIYFIKYKNKKYELVFHDTSGQEKYKALTKNFMRNKDGVLFVYDISSRGSFEDLNSWYNLYKEENEQIVGLILGNKCDKDKDREVNKEEAEKFAEDHNLKYLETSAKLDKKVKKAIACLLEEMIKANLNAKKINYCQIDNYSVFSRRSNRKKCC